MMLGFSTSAGGLRDSLISAPVAEYDRFASAFDEHQVVIEEFSHEILCFDVERRNHERLTRNLSVSFTVMAR